MSDPATMRAVADEAHKLARAEAQIHGFELLTLVWDPATGAYQLVAGGNVTTLVGLLTRAAMALDAQVTRYTGQGQEQPPQAPPVTPVGVLQ